MKALALGVVLAVVLVGCSTEQPASTPTSQTSFNLPVVQDTAYLQTLRNEYPQYDSVSDALLIETGKKICYELDEGVSLEDIVTNPVDPPLTAQMWAYNVGAAIGVYCPRHTNQIRQLQGG
jgi:hypothetical protein